MGPSAVTPHRAPTDASVPRRDRGEPAARTRDEAGGAIWSLATLVRTLPGRLARVTTSGRFIPEVDGLRFLAIAPVVLLHLATNLRRTQAVVYAPPADQDVVGMLTKNGGVGVAIFFAISGFILAIPFATAFLRGAEPVRLRAFYLRRLTRLEPPYLATLLGFYLVHVLLLDTDARQMFPHLVASALYVHNVVYGAWSTVNPVAWSLEIEVQFYLLAPLLGRVFLVRRAWVRRASMLAVAVACFAIAQWVPLSRLNLDKSLLNHLQYFLPGLLFADLYVSGLGAARRPRRLAWDLAGVAALAFLALAPDGMTRNAGIPVASLVLFFTAFRSRLLSGVLANRWITAIGGMCYTIYLIHYPLISLLTGLTAPISWTTRFAVNYLLQAVLILPVVLVVSTVLFLLIEKPCMRKDWPQRLAARVRAAL